MYTILVVEDEYINQKGIECVLKRFETFNVLCAEDGLQAKKIIEEQDCDAILLDICMPRMDGLELLEWLDLANKKPYTIIISGHEEFEYAQRAVKLGASDYILKPISSKEVMEIGQRIQDFLNVKTKNTEENNKFKDEITKSRAIIRERFLQKVLAGKIPESELLDKEMFYGIDFHYNHFLVGLIEVEQTYASMAPSEEEFQISLKRIEKILQESISNRFNCEWFYIDSEIICLLFKNQDINGAILEFLEDTIKRFNNDEGIVATIGLGNVTQSYADIPKSYKQASKALQQKIIMGPGYIYTNSDMNSNPILKALDDHIIDFQSAVKTINFESIKAKINLIADFISENKKSITHFELQYVSNALLNSFLQLCHEYNISLFGIEENPFDLANNIKSLSEFTTWFIELTEKVKNNLSIANAKANYNLAKSIRNIIEQKFNQNIALFEIAKSVGFSPNYAGRIFKDEFNLTVSEYINKCRIEKAKELLLKTDMKAYQIAEITGFKDQYYFSQVFKKLSGLSPKDFKEKCLKELN